MLNLNPEIVQNVIDKARVIGIEEDMGMSGDDTSPSDAEWKQILADYQEDLSYIELKTLINDLEPDQQITLIALMYVGRGDFDLNEWHAARHAANRIPVESRADYLIAKPMLADYLEEGLAKFGYTDSEI